MYKLYFVNGKESFQGRMNSNNVIIHFWLVYLETNIEFWMQTQTFVHLYICNETLTFFSEWSSQITDLRKLLLLSTQIVVCYCIHQVIRNNVSINFCHSIFFHCSINFVNSEREKTENQISENVSWIRAGEKKNMVTDNFGMKMRNQITLLLSYKQPWWFKITPKMTI